MFISVALSVEIAWQWWFSSQSDASLRIKKRLKIVEAGSKEGAATLSLLKNRRLAESASAEAFLVRLYGIDFLDRTLQQSGCKWTVSSFLARSIIFFIFGFFITLILQPILMLGIAVGIGCSVMPMLYVFSKRKTRLEKLERQLPEVADLIARSLRAGHAFPSTVQMVADEMTDPIASEFRMIADEVNFGVPMAVALQKMAMRIPLTDLRYMVIAILIQRESGGNLAELMTNISLLIRERLKLLGQIRTLSAEGKLSAWILGLLPLMICLVLGVLNPGYFDLLISDPDGMQLIILAVGLMLVGAFWMRKIIKIHI